MTTYRELIYMCLDLLKGNSDDYTYTEEHIAYLLDKYRAQLLKQRYLSDPKKYIPHGNYQTVFLSMSKEEEGPLLYKSDYKVPTLMQLGIPRVSTTTYYNYTIEYVSKERFPFVGNSRYLYNINYCTIDNEGYLILKPSKNFELNLSIEPSTEIPFEEINLTAVFENPKEILENYNYSSQYKIDNDILNQKFPIEEALITTLVDMVVRTLLSANYRPSDNTNDATDDMSNMNSFIARNMKDQYLRQQQPQQSKQ